MQLNSFFQFGCIQPGLNSNLMILLSKVKNALTIDKFRPIMLNNFLVKIVTKILANQLALVANRVVSPNQFCFIRGHYIKDCIYAASNCVNLLVKKYFEGNVAMEIDIKKDVDTSSWYFLRGASEAFGFFDNFCNWIYANISFTWVYILHSGVLFGYFPCSRMVRQRNPLSSISYSINEDFFSRMIIQKTSENELTPMLMNMATSARTHFLYLMTFFYFVREACLIFGRWWIFLKFNGTLLINL